MLRIHFDLANEGQDGPQYHLQIGGKQQEGEFYWHPTALSVPRISHMPMDLVLSSELIAATFFPTQYERIRREPTWINARRVSQAHLIKDYLEKATHAVDVGESVLEAFWNVRWD